MRKAKLPKQVEEFRWVLLSALKKFFCSTKTLLIKKKHSPGIYKTIESNLGYEPNLINTRQPMYARRRKNFLKNNQKFNLMEKDPKYKLKTQNSIIFNDFHEIITKYKDIGIEVIFFSPPGVKLEYAKRDFIEFIQETQSHYIEVNSTHYPSLFTKENFFDKEHLNINGAELFTKILAQRYLELKRKEVDSNAF